jgi:hypothetical protein
MKRSNQPASIARKSESGSALIVSLLLLFVMTLMAMSTIDAVSRDQQVAGYQSRKSISLYAAEAGLAEAMRTLEADGEPSVATTSLGDSSIYPHGQPSYALDSTSSDPVEDLGTSAIEGHTANIGGSNYQLHIFKVRVEGTAPGAVETRLEVAMGVFSANTAN